MRCLTLRERDSVTISKNGFLGETDAAALAQLEPFLPRGCLSWQHRAIRFGPFCGVLSAGDLTVELLPKTHEVLDTDERARGVLVGMLCATRHLTVSPGGESTLGQQRVHLLDQFIIDFCSRVNAALRKGAIALYQEHEENLEALRGRLILSHHVRKNAFNQSRLFCAFDERTVDNPHNRALKAVLATLRSRAIGAKARANVIALLHRFDVVVAMQVTPEDISRLAFDRLTDYWRPIFTRAKWFLEGLFPDVRFGNVVGTCLLFNMERLFEAFIGAKLRQAWRSVARDSFRIQLQGPGRSLANCQDGDVFRLRPDITVFENEDIVRIFDVKWKRLDAEAVSHGVAPSDIYQVAAYAGRYRCSRVALIYPTVAGCTPGLIATYSLAIPGNPILEIFAVDVQDIVRGGSLPSELLPSSTQKSH